MTETADRSVRLLRVGEQVRHAISDILARGDVHDETLARQLVTITEVRMVARRVNMRYAARLKFLADESFDEGTRIDTLLRDPSVARDLDGA